MGWKKFIAGEAMPDKEDPKYRARYERDFNAGRRFADMVGISFVARHVSRWADGHRVAFLTIVFGMAIVLFLVQAYRVVAYYPGSDTYHGGYIERVDSAFLNTHRMKIYKN